MGPICMGKMVDMGSTFWNYDNGEYKYWNKGTSEMFIMKRECNILRNSILEAYNVVQHWKPSDFP